MNHERDGTGGDRVGNIRGKRRRARCRVKKQLAAGEDTIQFRQRIGRIQTARTAEKEGEKETMEIVKEKTDLPSLLPMRVPRDKLATSWAPVECCAARPAKTKVVENIFGSRSSPLGLTGL